jgi:hypothetical protein
VWRPRRQGFGTHVGTHMGAHMGPFPSSRSGVHAQHRRDVAGPVDPGVWGKRGPLLRRRVETDLTSGRAITLTWGRAPGRSLSNGLLLMFVHGRGLGRVAAVVLPAKAVPPVSLVAPLCSKGTKSK